MHSISLTVPSLILSFPAWKPHFTILSDAAANELIVLRWLHFVFGIIWIGLLYFFNLVGMPAMMQLDPPVRVKVYPVLMSRAMGWFRWSALVTVIVGMRYFFSLLSSDARNAGDPSLTFGGSAGGLGLDPHFRVDLVLQRPRRDFATARGCVTWGLPWWCGRVVDGPGAERWADLSNQHLAISVGGGLGLLMLLNTWFVVWRVQKRLIALRQRRPNRHPMPPEAAQLMRWGFSRRALDLASFPMLFFMGAASHYPFLSTVAR